MSVGMGERFEPRPGRPMAEWLVVTASRADWAQLAKKHCESLVGASHKPERNMSVFNPPQPSIGRKYKAHLEESQ